jgi:hypothetical protein
MSEDQPKIPLSDPLRDTLNELIAVANFQAKGGLGSSLRA